MDTSRSTTWAIALVSFVAAVVVLSWLVVSSFNRHPVGAIAVSVPPALVIAGVVAWAFQRAVTRS